MKKVGLITINDINNYGNRLQNYAVQKVLAKINIYSENIVDNSIFLFQYGGLYLDFKTAIKQYSKVKGRLRYSNFYFFSKKYIKYSNYRLSNDNLFNEKIINKYDYFIVGSDQVWHPKYNLSNIMLLKNIPKAKRISFAASFGVSNIPEKDKKTIKNELLNFNYISVREDKGKELIEELTNRKDVEVLVDPTMLLTCEEWDKLSKKPKMLKTNKYILNYFLGELSETRKNAIEKIAKENNCEVINILDKNSPFYVCGPSEFLYLEKNAFLICTDSFHSSVFALLYDVPFVVFDREEKGVENMGSRLDTLINKFKLDNRRYNGKYITKENLEHDYTNAYKILNEERKKSADFLKKSLSNKDSDN